MIVCLLTAGCMETAAQNNVIDEIVWVVGDEAIYKSEVEEARREGLKRGAQWEGDPYCIIPEQLAVNKLFLNQAELDSILPLSESAAEEVKKLRAERKQLRDKKTELEAGKKTDTAEGDQSHE